jgi:hypothetical protein
MNKFVVSIAVALFVAISPVARAYTHPGIPFTLDDLNALKANLSQEPWKSGYAALAADSHSSLGYGMQGPFANVSRNPNVNLTQWRNDMIAVYNLARMWYFTGNTAYAQKSHDILLAWANTQTSFTGQESGLDLGDYAFRFAGGASILRGTWSGWTSADTTAVQNLFANVYWPATSCATTASLGPANKGTLSLVAGMAIAVFCDDTTKFNHVIDLFRTSASAGLPNTLSTGQMGETGRDQGHAYGNLLSAAMTAEIAWKQGVDLFSEQNNRLFACGEFYANNNFVSGVQCVPMGTTDAYYWGDSGDAGGGYGADSMGLNILRAAYVLRKGLSAPWLDQKIARQPVNSDNFMTCKSADPSTATPPSAVTFPATASVTTGMTNVDINTGSLSGSGSYSSGTWTLVGGGTEVWTHSNDSCHFLYKQITGDCSIVAKVMAVGNTAAAAKAGVMIRDSVAITGSASNRCWIAIRPDNGFEGYNHGWTEMYGGSNWETRPRNGASMEYVPSMPYWLKLERRGNVISTFLSQDGTSWAAGTVGVYANMPSTAYIGLFVCALSSTTANTSTFQGAAVTGGDGGGITTPAAPAALIASASNAAATIRWLSSSGATSYNVLRSTTSGSGYASIATGVTTQSYTDATLTNGTTYYYVVTATNSAGTSGNSQQTAATPQSPMVNVAFGGTATSTDNPTGTPGTQAPASAFDTLCGSKWYDGLGATGWIQYDFGSGNDQTIKRYAVASANDVPGRDPKNWQFQGSPDGTTWTTLDTQSNQSFAFRYQTNTYNIGNTTAYRYYRLNVTANNGDPGTLQLSELALLTDTGHTIPNNTCRLFNRNSNKAFDVQNGSTADATPAVQWTATGNNSQKWTLTYQGNGQYQILGYASGKALDVSGASTANGAALIIWPWSGANNQLWTVTPTGDGFFKLTALHSGKVADVNGGSTADGATIIQYPYGSGLNQQWSISIAP